MILTGKALEDFKSFVFSHHGIGYSQLVSDTYLKALIVEFFDSVGYIINIVDDSFNICNSCDNEDCEGNCLEYSDSPCCDYYMPSFETYIRVYSIQDNVGDYKDYDVEGWFKTRQKATEKAILKANEIYNERANISNQI